MLQNAYPENLFFLSETMLLKRGAEIISINSIKKFLMKPSHLKSSNSTEYYTNRSFTLSDLPKAVRPKEDNLKTSVKELYT